VGDGNECTATSHSNTEPALTHADPDNGKPYGGDEFLELYNLMVGCTACWWYSNGNFTFEMFVGFLLMHEGSGEFLYSMLDAFAGAQQVYVGGGGKGTLGPYCPSGICMNGVLNYFAAFSESARNLVDEYVRNGTDISNYMGFGGRAINDPARVISEANLYGSIMLYPKPTIFYAPNQDVNVSWTLDPNPMSGLSNYGNGHKDLVVELNKNGLAANTFYPGGYMGIYYYTGKKGYYSVWMSAGGEQSWSP